MDIRRTLALLLIVFTLGTATAADGGWEEVYIGDGLGLEENYLDYGYELTYEGDGERFFITSGTGEVPTGDQYGDAEFSAYSQYFSMEAPPSTDAQVERYFLTEEPAALYYSSGPSGQPVTYSTYQSTYRGANSLWIQGPTSWTQYAVCPFGAWLKLLAYTSTGGTSAFYEIYPSNELLYKSYPFYSGYNRLSFRADEVGRHILLFVVNNQPSNVVIVDVRSGIWPPWPPGPTPPSPGYSKVTVKSNWLKGYNVDVDGIYQRNDVSDGSLDGVCTFTVSGDQYHSIKISNVGYIRTYYRYFNSGYHYTLTI